MSASIAIHSYGSAISWATTLAGSYTELAEVCSISDDLTVKEVKVTHLKSDNAAHEYIAGFIEGGRITLELNFIKTQLTHIFSVLRTALFYKITDSDGSVSGFKGFYVRKGKKLVEDDRITLAVEIKVTGLPTFVAA